MDIVKKTVLYVCIAAVLWALMFSPDMAPHVPFWPAMTLSAVLLSTLALSSGRDLRRRIRLTWIDFIAGAAVAAVLWAVFFAGDKLSSLLFRTARSSVDSIYAIKGGVSPWLLSALLLFVIGPAEEIFWRGFVQDGFGRRFGPDAAFFIATLLYAAIHLPSGNFMLVLAAAVAGCVWGLAYRFFPERFGAIIISHALWDAAVFVWLPIM